MERVKERVQSDKGRQADEEEHDHVQLDISEGAKERNQLPCLPAAPWTDKIEPGTQREDQGYGVGCNEIHHDHSVDEDDE